MSRDNASLLDIIKSAQLSLQFTQGLEKTELATNLEKQSAILYPIKNPDCFVEANLKNLNNFLQVVRKPQYSPNC